MVIQVIKVIQVWTLVTSHDPPLKPGGVITNLRELAPFLTKVRTYLMAHDAV